MGAVEKQWSNCYVCRNLVRTYKTVVYEVVALHDPPAHGQNVWLLLKLELLSKVDPYVPEVAKRMPVKISWAVLTFC